MVKMLSHIVGLVIGHVATGAWNLRRWGMASMLYRIFGRVTAGALTVVKPARQRLPMNISVAIGVWTVAIHAGHGPSFETGRTQMGLLISKPL